MADCTHMQAPARLQQHSKPVILSVILNDWVCRTAKSPLGYSLPAFPWYIDQSIGGALATGTHGSSFRYGSLSSQVLLAKRRSLQQHLKQVAHCLQLKSMLHAGPSCLLHIFRKAQAHHIMRCQALSCTMCAVSSGMAACVINKQSEP